MSIYTDEKGYKRHSNLVHRQKVYEQIYKKNRHKYPLPFSEYVVHHKDGNKENNNIENLEILTPEEHDAVHGLNKYYSNSISYPKRNHSKSYKKRNIFSNFFIFHLIALIIFWAILFFIIVKIFNLNYYFAFVSGFLSAGFASIIVMIVIYLFLASWWVEGIRKSLH